MAGTPASIKDHVGTCGIDLLPHGRLCVKVLSAKEIDMIEAKGRGGDALAHYEVQWLVNNLRAERELAIMEAEKTAAKQAWLEEEYGPNATRIQLMSEVARLQTMLVDKDRQLAELRTT